MCFTYYQLHPGGALVSELKIIHQNMDKLQLGTQSKLKLTSAKHNFNIKYQCYMVEEILL